MMMKPSRKYLLRELYYGKTRRASAFRYALLAVDLAVLLFLFVSSFFHGERWVEMIDVAFGFALLLDVLARLWLSDRKLAFLLHPSGIADVLVIISLLLPLIGENLAFLRVVRALRLFRSYQVVERLRQDWPYFQKNEDVILNTVNLLVFLFVMTALVYETQVGRNPGIDNYVNALYFTVTALTTTGFGDITLKGTTGELLAITIMIIGVSLFLRLLQSVFRPHKVRFACPSCGLFLHDRDAVHCKHCGIVLNIPDEGL